MKDATYKRIKSEFITIFIVTLVTLLSTTLYEISKTGSVDLFSSQLWNLFFKCFLSVSIAIGIIMLGIWAIYKLTYKVKKNK